MILSHKKPQKVSDLVGNPDAFGAALDWAREWERWGSPATESGKTPAGVGGKSGAPPKPLIVCGPIGTGKTALAYAIASEMGWELFEFNASDLRDEESVSGILSNAASSGGLFGGKRLVLIDDVDALSGREDRGGAGAIAKVLSSAQQPIILTAVDFYNRKLQTIRTYCMHLELRRVSAPSVSKLLRSLSSEHGFKMTEEQIAKIAQGAGGDVRAALNDLQGRNTGALRDVQQNIFEVLRAILKGSKYSEARKAAFNSDVEHDTLKLWVAHNIPLEYDRPFDAAEAYNSLSRADIFDGRIRRSQYYGYLRYSSDLLSSGVATAKSAPYHKYTPMGFPDYLREMGASKGSRAMRKAVLVKIGKQCHCSLSQAQSYLPLLEQLAKKHPQEISGEFGFEEEELAFVAKTPVKKEKKGKKGNDDKEEKGEAKTKKPSARKKKEGTTQKVL